MEAVKVVEGLGIQEVGTKKLHILVVDDNVDHADSTAVLLRMYGHEVEVARDGPVALEAALAHRPDIILLDIGLPGMDGWKVAEKIQAHAAEKKPLVIAITGYGQPADYQQSSQSGIHMHMVKPIDPHVLLDLLKRFQGIIDN